MLSKKALNWTAGSEVTIQAKRNAETVYICNAWKIFVIYIFTSVIFTLMWHSTTLKNNKKTCFSVKLPEAAPTGSAMILNQLLPPLPKLR